MGMVSQQLAHLATRVEHLHMRQSRREAAQEQRYNHMSALLAHLAHRYPPTAPTAATATASAVASSASSTSSSTSSSTPAATFSGGPAASFPGTQLLYMMPQSLPAQPYAATAAAIAAPAAQAASAAAGASSSSSSALFSSGASLPPTLCSRPHPPRLPAQVRTVARPVNDLFLYSGAGSTDGAIGMGTEGVDQDTMFDALDALDDTMPPSPLLNPHTTPERSGRVHHGQQHNRQSAHGRVGAASPRQPEAREEEEEQDEEEEEDEEQEEDHEAEDGEGEEEEEEEDVGAGGDVGLEEEQRSSTAFLVAPLAAPGSISPRSPSTRTGDDDACGSTGPSPATTVVAHRLLAHKGLGEDEPASTPVHVDQRMWL